MDNMRASSQDRVSHVKNISNLPSACQEHPLSAKNRVSFSKRTDSKECAILLCHTQSLAKKRAINQSPKYALELSLINGIIGEKELCGDEARLMPSADSF
jgi:hypothetical protein